jgi:hypothetical protein
MLDRFRPKVLDDFAASRGRLGDDDTLECGPHLRQTTQRQWRFRQVDTGEVRQATSVVVSSRSDNFKLSGWYDLNMKSFYRREEEAQCYRASVKFHRMNWGAQPGLQARPDDGQ